MSYLEELFDLLWEEPEPKTPEYQEIRDVLNRLSDKMEAMAGRELTDKCIDANWEYMEIKCRSFFFSGLRLGLELLRL